MKKRILSALLVVAVVVFTNGLALLASTYEPVPPVAYPACCAELALEAGLFGQEEGNVPIQGFSMDCGCGSGGWCCGGGNCSICSRPPSPPVTCTCIFPILCSRPCCTVVCGRN